MIISVPVNDDTVEIMVEEFTTLERLIRAGAAPDSIKSDDPSEIELTEEAVKFMMDVTFSQTELSKDELNALTEENCMETMSRVVIAAFGVEPYPIESSDYKLDPSTVDFNDNGSVDLEDWR